MMLFWILFHVFFITTAVALFVVAFREDSMIKGVNALVVSIVVAFAFASLVTAFSSHVSFLSGDFYVFAHLGAFFILSLVLSTRLWVSEGLAFWPAFWMLVGVTVIAAAIAGYINWLVTLYGGVAFWLLAVPSGILAVLFLAAGVFELSYRWKVRKCVKEGGHHYKRHPLIPDICYDATCTKCGHRTSGPYVTPSDPEWGW